MAVAGPGQITARAQETGFAAALRSDMAGPSAAEDKEDSLRCLTLAVAYEAGNQSREGQQAVAEVVLNRLAHSAFPKTVCGVVWQGWQRGRGCQFTFVCDGALSRRLSDETISAARAVAMGTLAAGKPRLVAGALNYHANYVSPAWAANLVRVGRIGAHIFYRPLPGGSPEGGLPGGDAQAQAAASDSTGARWAQPDHGMIMRAYARYSRIGQGSAGENREPLAPAPSAPHDAQEPKVFAPWGLALR
ncbi:hypothetical protein AQZ52_15840 [Novosphingobium fuchskuhlense]|uniref:Cell wall hydrolase SleB domain-containing protein n=1 Tax=Novosphingobium fuchskuhlense TaxID=1117702 RepID=A0A117UT33_9SPHN|nr:hypothetical protein AQZ52_15840 [Novosphingobium fuchskuhlense]